jgi:hypothetical protein
MRTRAGTARRTSYANFTLMRAEFRWPALPAEHQSVFS